METYQLLRDPIGRVLGGVQHCPELSHEHPVEGKIFSGKQVDKVHLAVDEVHLAGDVPHLAVDIILLAVDIIPMTVDLVHLAVDLVHLAVDITYLSLYLTDQTYSPAVLLLLASTH